MATLLYARCHRSQDGYSFISISPRLGFMYRALKKPGKGGRKDRIHTAYFGFDSEAEAAQFLAWLTTKHPTAKAMKREPERLACSHEIKVWEFDGLHQLILTCATRQTQQKAAA